MGRFSWCVALMVWAVGSTACDDPVVSDAGAPEGSSAVATPPAAIEIGQGGVAGSRDPALDGPPAPELTPPSPSALADAGGAVAQGAGAADAAVEPVVADPAAVDPAAVDPMVGAPGADPGQGAPGGAVEAVDAGQQVGAAVGALRAPSADEAGGQGAAGAAPGLPEPARVVDAGCSGVSPPQLAGCVDKARYEVDLRAIVGARSPSTPQWEAVQALCAARFEALGYTVERHDYGSGVNVLGVRAGVRLPEERVLIGAHYDSVAGCPGADDNGTGVAGVLEAARVLASAPHARTLVVVCWDEEELGLKGSRAHAARSAQAGEKIAAAFVLEMIGYEATAERSQRLPPGFDQLFPEVSAGMDARGWRGDFLAVVAGDDAKIHAEALARHGAAVSLAIVPLSLTAEQRVHPALSDLRRSDHTAFWERGFPAMMITDTAEFRYDAYHCRKGPDQIEGLSHDFARKAVAATVGAAAEALSPPR